MSLPLMRGRAAPAKFATEPNLYRLGDLYQRLHIPSSKGFRQVGQLSRRTPVLQLGKGSQPVRTLYVQGCVGRALSLS